jgi:hypothetical protein
MRRLGTVAMLSLGVVVPLSAGDALAEGVIKGGTVIITPGATVEGIGNIRPGADGTTIAIDCPGGRSFVLSAANAPGSCSAKTAASGDVESARCDDGGGNAAVVVCALDEGKGACSVTIGQGTCQVE